MYATPDLAVAVQNAHRHMSHLVRVCEDLGAEYRGWEPAGSRRFHEASLRLNRALLAMMRETQALDALDYPRPNGHLTRATPATVEAAMPSAADPLDSTLRAMRKAC